MDFKEYLQHNIVILDGGMGSLLQARGLQPGEAPERWNLTHADDIIDIQKAYYDSGSNVVNTNTFGANLLHFDEDELEDIIKAAIDNANAAREQSTADHAKFVALDIGPTGRLLKPMGDLDFEEAVSIFAKTVQIGVSYGVDLIMIETMNDSYETKAALLAAKENSDLPVIVSNAYSENGKLMTGASPAAMVALLESMGADAIGVNCSFGPDKLAPIVREYLRYASVPVLLKPNAGLPHSENGCTVYDILPEEFSQITACLVREGVRVAGGCCGTTPEYIKNLCDKINVTRATQESSSDNLYNPSASCLGTSLYQREAYTVISSYTHAVFFTDDPVLIGERINPTGKKRLKEALRSNELDYILGEGLKQQSAGAQVLDVNVGLPEIDEPAMLCRVVYELQAIIDLPLQIDTSDPVAMEKALRIYNGKPLINSVNGKQESMDAIFPLMKKYGGTAIALTLDENGIPETAEGRVAIAKRIIDTAASYGIDKKDLIFDTLAMAVCADNNAAKVTLESLSIIRHELGVHTSLGVSNISFGLPQRDIVNATFFALALENGLSAAIMNPFSAEMMKTWHAYRVLKGIDENCTDYIAFADTVQNNITIGEKTAKADEDTLTLQGAIIKGLKDQAAKLCADLLQTVESLTVVQEHIIPALDKVGQDYEQGRVYLPGLLMSAEAAKFAFEEIKKRMTEGGGKNKCAVVIATVKGDIHDIGKNIVKLLLENYGFDVHDLGKDVAPEAIVEETVRLHAPIVGLSALMTTTVPSMEETIKQLRVSAPWAKVVVGGAVMTAEYAASIDADKYCKDAMDTVRYAEQINQL
ncbi:MAG: homocysteine S-methyltransferase family protein [Ruminococcus sp.]|uniref:homocysteine S-methyltransferase family protein n=1 Tax=Ruminococcus sp. TaxID=41978 RepID=UPI002873A0D6|nr:homocysteine S-methyltransferase family protein [Ruminococcus sp.]MBQ3284082.1 homocysteine S-methyltransferase family protein [Ruminococcus sp.]